MLMGCYHRIALTQINHSTACLADLFLFQILPARQGMLEKVLLHPTASPSLCVL